ncbi:hypothetical protein [Microbispora sp. GKU 823]|uniref:hypothetical protein n=1 Tax=Microbispora sp. GKU 823 TaxID=1652100 RepID=UPI00267F2A1A|nr:hypothetical protein [Microbispora sp. GKU 823]
MAESIGNVTYRSVTPCAEGGERGTVDAMLRVLAVDDEVPALSELAFLLRQAPGWST